MSYTLRYDSDIHCMFLRVKGKVTIELIGEIAPEVGRMSTETGCFRLLNDMSETTIDIATLELFDSPKIMDDSHVSRAIKRALVVPPTFKEPRFLENVSRNRGHNLKVFKNIEEAKKWLFDE